MLLLRTPRSLLVTLAALLALSYIPPNDAISLSYFYPFGKDVNDSIMYPGDDVSSDVIKLDRNIVLYNKSYNSLYVNMNGHVTFGGPLSAYRSHRELPYGAGIGIVAAFLADIDTSRTGRLYYRSTRERTILDRAAADIQTYFTGFENYFPSMVFVATWDAVGYYSAQFDKKNTFQLVLVTDGRSSFSIFHYADTKIEWTESQGKDGEEDLPPQAGFDNGDGRSFTLMGSAKTGDFIRGTNANFPGLWLYRIGSLPTGNVVSADNVTVDVTVFDLETQDNCFDSASICSPNAQCIDYEDSFCCKCIPPYYGNGKSCLHSDEPQQISGRVFGRVNGINLRNNSQLHTYVVTTDGRTYSALTRLPEELLAAFESLSSIGGIMGWMFAIRINPLAKNGYQFTGGKLNRTSRITFQGHDGQDYMLQIKQYFHGHDDVNQIRMDTYLDGNIPVFPKDTRIAIDSYHENFKKTAPGTIKSFAARTYRANDVILNYTWDNTITFEECGEDREASIGDVMRLSVSKIFVRISERNTVRYTMKSLIGIYAGDDPCAKASELCHSNADCIPDKDSYKCVCMAGYTGDGSNCQDVDECQHNPCGENADCYNEVGTYRCRCRPGYESDGKGCRPSRLCGPYQCDDNARCVEDLNTRQYRCECKNGFQGDGRTCSRLGQITKLTCRDADICSDNAECIYDDDLREYRCECRDEFSGDGYTGCDAVIGETNEDICSQCDRYADCDYNEDLNRHVCQCRPRFTGNGYQCTIIDECRTCDDYALCIFNDDTSNYECECRRGYKGDGLTCEIQDCREDESMCDPEGGICWHDKGRNMSFCRCNYGYIGSGFECERMTCDYYLENYCHPQARCIDNGRYPLCVCPAGYIGNGRDCELEDSEGSEEKDCNVVWNCDANAMCFETTGGRHECRCKDGFEGDGKVCRKQEPVEQGCNVLRDCDANARCVSASTGRYVCQCNPGYTGDGKSCQRQDVDCSVLNDCDTNARCTRDSTGRFYCRCNTGYRGDGKTCSRYNIGCNLENNCHQNAFCVRNPDINAHQCRCNRGYEGDGITCTRREVIDCRRDPRLCGSNAECVPGTNDEYVCVCNPGYRGDGSSCSRVIEEGNYLVYAQGNKIMRISANEYSNENGQILAYEPGMLAVGVEIDCQEGDIYWTDAAHGVIKRAKSNGSDIENLVNGMKSPEGIAIDFVARNMFFTDSEMDSLHVAKLNGSDVKTLVNTDMFNPRAIVLDVSRGVVYWTDWNRNYPQIERINMDGTEREVLVADNLSLPNGLAFDHYSQTLCWGDAGTQKIECMREDGAGRRVVYGQASYPFDLTLLNNVIYWTDWRMREIPFVNQNGGEMNKGLKPAMGGHGRAYGITALRDRCPRARNSCGLNNGGCKYLCLPTASGGRTCACPDGMDPRACEN